MKKDSSVSPVAGNEPADAIEIIANSMIQFREEMECFNALGSRIASKTRLIMRVVFVTLSISSIYLVFMILQMASNMSVMTSHLEDMYKNFGTMAGDMSEIAVTVDSMGRSISGMPSIAGSTLQMDRDVSYIKDSLYGINHSIKAIDTDMLSINSNMREMNARLFNMSRSVNMMSYDVKDMALPMNSGPLSGFWPK